MALLIGTLIFLGNFHNWVLESGQSFLKKIEEMLVHRHGEDWVVWVCVKDERFCVKPLYCSLSQL